MGLVVKKENHKGKAEWNPGQWEAAVGLKRPIGSEPWVSRGMNDIMVGAGFPIQTIASRSICESLFDGL